MFWSILVIVSMVTLEPRFPAARAESPLPSPVKHRIVLHRVYADSSESVIDPGGVAMLDEAAKTLRGELGTVVIVERTAGRTGSRGHDPMLSRRRAEAVRSYLMSHGVPAERIVLKGFGELPWPSSPTTTASGTQNSRVELFVD